MRARVAAAGFVLSSLALLLSIATAPSACDQPPDDVPDAALPPSTPDRCTRADPPFWCDAGVDASVGCAFGQADGVCIATGPLADTCACSDCADAAACVTGCLADGVCGEGADGGLEDCTCADCSGTPSCAPPAVGCVDDGVCSPDTDDCVCADCAEDAACRGCVSDGYCAVHLEACVCHDCATEPRCLVDGG